jgi:bla regulator protein blaR1
MMAELANHLWQSTLVAALALIVTLALRRERAGVRYGVWLAASLKFLIPFSALTSLGALFGWRPIVVASVTPHEVFVNAGGGALPERAVRIVANQPPGVSLLHTIGSMLPQLLVAVWIVGAVILLTAWAVRWRRISRIARSSPPMTDGAVLEELRALEHRAGLSHPIAVVTSSSSFEPGVFGVVAPTLIWPSGLEAHLSREQVRAILAHEVVHVRRRDNLMALAHLLAQAAFWFHPMVWWIGARLVDERERACDEAVLDAGSERHSYAESILTTCRLFTESPLACVSGVTGADLKKRIEHIMTSDVRSRLNMWKKGLLAVAGSAALAVPFVIGVVRVQPALAQGGNSNAAFDVTSVKPNNSGSGMIRMLPAANGGWQAENVPLGMLVRLAFQLQDNQIVGGPKWLFEDRFDVMGSGTAPGRDGPMFDKVKQMLADRFKLVTHVETREQSMYALVLARSDGKLGEKMTPSTADCTPTGPNGRGRGQGAPPAPGERPKCGVMIGPGKLMVGGQTMAAFATNLSRFAGGIVVDKTNLKGTYDIELTYAPDPGISLTGRDLPPQPGAPPPPAAIGDAPSLFSAVQEQLGLKLDATKGPVDVLVIDSAEKPRPD